MRSPGLAEAGRLLLSPPDHPESSQHHDNHTLSLSLLLLGHQVARILSRSLLGENGGSLDPERYNSPCGEQAISIRGDLGFSPGLRCPPLALPHI